MKFAITGSTGRVSRPLVEILSHKSHDITVISSHADRKAEIETLGACAAIGTIEDVEFLAATFTGMDAVYCMLPPPRAFIDIGPSETEFDFMREAERQAQIYQEAIQRSGVKHIVHLSSVGADFEAGTGFIRQHYAVEKILQGLPTDIGIVHLRPVGFYYNMFGFIKSIKDSGRIVANYGGSDMVPWVSPVDIAAVAAAELEDTTLRRTAPYIASDELACDEVAELLGRAIGRPDLTWEVIGDQDLMNGLLAAGMAPALAKDYVELNASIHSGRLYADFNRNRPEFGRVKIQHFAPEFVKVFNK